MPMSKVPLFSDLVHAVYVRWANVPIPPKEFS